MQSIKIAIKEAAWVFLLSRILFLFITYITVVLLPENGQKMPIAASCHNLLHNPCVLAWYHWDAGAYIRIASQGYSFTPDVGFFPLWPLLVHIGGLLSGGSFPLSYYLAAMLLSNLFFFIALVLLYRLLCEDFEPSLAKRALFFLSFYPYALFFFAGYTESLFVMLCIAVFLLLQRGKALDWWFAGILGFLAALTRSSGVLLVIPFFIMYLRHFRGPSEGTKLQWLQRIHASIPHTPGFWKTAQSTQPSPVDSDSANEAQQESKPSHTNWLLKLNAFVPIILIPFGVVAYMIYLGYTKGNPLVFRTVEATYWARHFDWIWHTYYVALHTIATRSLYDMFTLRNILDITFTVIPVTALILGWKRLPLHYSFFALAVVLFSLSFPISTIDPLASQSRYMMGIFPIIVVFALRGKHPRFEQAFLAVSLPLLTILSMLFITHYWVA